MRPLKKGSTTSPLPLSGISPPSTRDRQITPALPTFVFAKRVIHACITKIFAAAETKRVKNLSVHDDHPARTQAKSRSAGAPPAPADQPTTSPQERTTSAPEGPTEPVLQSTQIHSNLHNSRRLRLTPLPISYIMLTNKYGWNKASTKALLGHPQPSPLYFLSPLCFAFASSY